MALDTAARVSNANSKIGRVERVVLAREYASPLRMAEVGRIVDEWREETGNGTPQTLLTAALAVLPEGHPERAGMIRAIELLRTQS